MSLQNIKPHDHGINLRKPWLKIFHQWNKIARLEKGTIHQAESKKRAKLALHRAITYSNEKLAC